jgi:hypothetical protein
MPAGGWAQADGGSATSGPASVSNSATVSQSLSFDLSGLMLEISIPATPGS